MKTCAVMAAIHMNDEQLGYVRQIAARFKQLNQMPVRIITNKDLPAVYLAAGHWARYYAWDVLPSDIERIVYLDIDILPLKALPPFPDVDFAATEDYDNTRNRVFESFPYLKQRGIYFNSGFFIATRKMRRIFRRVLDMMPSQVLAPPFYADQTPLNIEVQRALEKDEITFKLLSRRWSCLPLHEGRLVDPCMLHCTGIPWLKKLQFISYLVDHVNRTEFGIEPPVGAYHG